MMQELENFCNERGLRVNLGKTKIMRFGPKPKTPMDVQFKGDEIEFVSQYTYLEVPISNKKKNIFSQAQKAAAQKGARASIAMQRRCKEIGLSDPLLKVSLFKTMVLPILLYGCKV